MVKVIHLKFRFLKNEEELVIATLIRFVVVNITSTIIYRALNIDDYTQVKK